MSTTSGGALNGKTVMQERVLKVVGTGYSAVYMKASAQTFEHSA